MPILHIHFFSHIQAMAAGVVPQFMQLKAYHASFTANRIRLTLLLASKNLGSWESICRLQHAMNMPGPGVQVVAAPSRRASAARHR
jgi:hypothetical protein